MRATDPDARIDHTERSYTDNEWVARLLWPAILKRWPVGLPGRLRAGQYAGHGHGHNEPNDGRRANARSNSESEPPRDDATAGNISAALSQQQSGKYSFAPFVDDGVRITAEQQPGRFPIRS